MSSSSKTATTLIAAFLGGALIGATVAVLFAPEKGSDTRARLKKMLDRKGVKISDSEVDELVAELSGSIAE